MNAIVTPTPFCTYVNGMTLEMDPAVPAPAIDLARIHTAGQELLQTPLLRDRPIQSRDQLRIFMETHVFAVWDFMCLTKSLQHAIAPSDMIWLPPASRRSARLINEIVAGEESDVSMDGQSYLSHFEIYLEAMEEVGADTVPCRAFLDLVRAEGIEAALEKASMPEAARRFVRSTIDFVQTCKPWVVGAAFTYGREDVIPDMFRELIENGVIDDANCPAFRYYLQRHIDVDGGTEEHDGHGKMAEEMLAHLCAGSRQRMAEATEAAVCALEARKGLWEELHRALR